MSRCCHVATPCFHQLIAGSTSPLPPLARSGNRVVASSVRLHGMWWRNVLVVSTSPDWLSLAVNDMTAVGVRHTPRQGTAPSLSGHTAAGVAERAKIHADAGGLLSLQQDARGIQVRCNYALQVRRSASEDNAATLGTLQFRIRVTDKIHTGARVRHHDELL